LTSLACICEDLDIKVPPFVLYPGKSTKACNLVDLPPQTDTMSTAKGWITTHSFRYWVESIFLKNIPSTRPVLLILDGHSTHITWELTKYRERNLIELLCLPSHASHILQPLDVGVFGPMKNSYTKHCDICLSQTNTNIFNAGKTIKKVIDKYVFGGLFKKAYYDAMSANNVLSAFESTGIWPINRNRLNWDKVAPAEAQFKTTAKHFGFCWTIRILGWE